MARGKRVNVGHDGSISFVAGETLPSSVKKLQQSPEIEDFYRFVHENDLRLEAYKIIDEFVSLRKKDGQEKKK